MQEEFVNCPTNKSIHDHFRDQLVQLSIRPRSEEDRLELMNLLNKYLSYPDDEQANNHRMANKLGMLDIEAEHRQHLAQEGDRKAEYVDNVRETKILKLHNQVKV